MYLMSDLEMREIREPMYSDIAAVMKEGGRKGRGRGGGGRCKSK